MEHRGPAGTQHGRAAAKGQERRRPRHGAFMLRVTQGSQTRVSHDPGPQDSFRPASSCRPLSPRLDTLTPLAGTSWATSKVGSGSVPRPGKQKPAPACPQPARANSKPGPRRAGPDSDRKEGGQHVAPPLGGALSDRLRAHTPPQDLAAPTTQCQPSVPHCRVSPTPPRETSALGPPEGKDRSALPRWPQLTCPCPAYCPPTTQMGLRFHFC